MVKLAVNHFLGKEGYSKVNCAQAVLCGFKNALNISDELVDSYSAFGTGRAPHNVCGAVFAAEAILTMEEKTEQLERLKEYFEANAGSVKCKEIRTVKKMSCKGCVENAATIVSEIIFGELECAGSSKAL